MQESFIGSETGLIFGIILIFVAVADYVFFRYFAPHFLRSRGEEFAQSFGRIRRFAPYWITALIVFGLYLILQYVRAA